LKAADKGILDNVVADAVRAAMQWPDCEKEKNSWVIIESGLLPPTAMEQIDEIVAWIRADQDKTNPLVRAILKSDLKLHTHVINTCNAWGMSLGQLKQSKKNELYKNMRTAYTHNVRMKPEQYETTLPCSKTDLGIHLEGTAITRTAIHQSKAGALMRLRSILRYGNPIEKDKCAYCNNGDYHTPMHVIVRCAFPPTVTMRTNMNPNVTADTPNIHQSNYKKNTSGHHGWPTSPIT
jgi:hypothetical protein